MIVLSAQTHQGTAHNTAYKAKSCSVMEATEQLNLPSANCIAVTLRAPVGDEGWYSLGSKEGWWLLAGYCHQRQMCGWAVEEPPDVCIHREMRHLQKLQRSSSGSSLEGVTLRVRSYILSGFPSLGNLMAWMKASQRML